MTKLADFWRRQGVLMKIILSIVGAFAALIIFGLILMALGVDTSDDTTKSAASSTSARPSSTTASPSSTSTASSPSSSTSSPSHSPSSSASSASSTSSRTPSPSSTHSTTAPTASTASSNALPLGPKGNYPVAGPMPSPDNNVIGGYQCAEDSAVLSSDGHLLVMNVKPVTTWSVDFDDAEGNPIGSSANGTVGEGDSTINAQATDPSKVKYAQITASGATNTTCTVILTK